jgi:hypothetical protein
MASKLAVPHKAARNLVRMYPPYLFIRRLLARASLRANIYCHSSMPPARFISRREIFTAFERIMSERAVLSIGISMQFATRLE